MLVLCAVLVATGCTSSPKEPATHAHAVQPVRATPSTSLPMAYLSFREGVIDSAHRHGQRDARLYPDGMLAVQTRGSSGGSRCAPRPSRVAASGTHAVVLDYGTTVASGACHADLQTFTSVVRLPPGVAAQLPLRVVLRLPGGSSYSVDARG